LIVYGFVGASGTGKSHRALFVARQHEVHYIIDDGLLIHLNKRIAGRSAKREQTYIAAVKRAIFHHPEHREEVSRVLKSHQPEAIMVVGTSVEMVEKIAMRVCLSSIDEIIYIEDVSTTEEIQLARQMRVQHGKHVIPVPSIEIKSDFSGYFLDKLKVFRIRKGSGLEMAEKTIVRPTFSYLGRYTISQKAMIQIVHHCAMKNPTVKSLGRIRFHELASGVRVEVEVVLTLGVIIPEEVNRVMQGIKTGIEGMTQLNIQQIHVYVKGLR